MSEQGLAARALAALVPSRRRANASVRTVADLVRERERAEAEFAARGEPDTAPSEEGGPATGTTAPAAPTDAGTGPVPAAPRAPASVPAVSPLVAQRIAETRRVAPRIGWGPHDAPDPSGGLDPVVAWDGGRDADGASGTPAGDDDASSAGATEPAAPDPDADPYTDPTADPATAVIALPAAPDAGGSGDGLAADLAADRSTVLDVRSLAERDTAPVPLAELAFGAGSAPATEAGPAAPEADGVPVRAAEPPDPGVPSAVVEILAPTAVEQVPAPGAFPITVVTAANSAALASEAGTVPGLVAGGALQRSSARGAPPVRAEAATRRPSAVPALLSDAELREALGEGPDAEDAEPEPSVVAMTTASTRPAPTPPVRAGALAPPWVRAALMGAEPRSSATPEQAAATRALRRTFGVPQDPGPVTLAGVEPVAAVAVLAATTPETAPQAASDAAPETAQDPAPTPGPKRKPRRPTPRTLVGAPVPVRYRAVRRGGEPVPGAEITAVDRTGVTVVDGLAGPDGRGRFVVQQPGPYILVGAAPGFQPGAAAVAAVAGTVDVDVLLVRSSSVAGTVRLDGEPVRDAQVTLVQDGEVVDMVQADRSGRFRVADLTVGEYALAVAAEGCPPTVMVVAVPEETDLAYDVDLASPPA